MKHILLVNQKGGAGKTMLADQVAFGLQKAGHIVDFKDMDGQGGAAHQNESNEGAEFCVVDTPGALLTKTRKWMSESDLIIIPTRCSGLDMPPLKRIMDIVAEFDKNNVIIVFNCWNRNRGTAEFINWFSVRYPGYKTFFMPNSCVLSDAEDRKISVWDYKPKHKAAETMNEFVNLILNTLGE